MKGKNVQRISAETNNQGSTVQCCITYESDWKAQQWKNLFQTPKYAGIETLSLCYWWFRGKNLLYEILVQKG